MSDALKARVRRAVEAARPHGPAAVVAAVLNCVRLRTFAEVGEPAHRPDIHPDAQPNHFFPEEKHDLSRLKDRDAGEHYARLVRTADANRGGWNTALRTGHPKAAPRVSEVAELPDKDEVKAIAQVGDAARGGYDETSRVVHHLLGSREDVHRWVMSNAILSAQEGWQDHTAGAFEALAKWTAAGRPTDPAGLDAVFGTTRRKGTAANPGAGAHVLDRRGTFAGPAKYTGSKAVALKDMFGQGAAPGVVWNWVSRGSYKTPNFAHAFVDRSGAPIDTHMAKLIDPGFTRRRMEQVVGAGGGREVSALLQAQKKVIEHPHVVLAYKTLLAQAAHELGWPLNQVQEAVWTGTVAVMAAMGKGAAPRAPELLHLLSRRAVQAGWSLKTVLERQDVHDHLNLLGIPSGRVRDAVAASDERLPAGRGPAGTSDPAALESVARRLPRTTVAAARPIAARFADGVDAAGHLQALASPGHAATRFGAHPAADHGMRHAVADGLERDGRVHEADLLRDPHQHVTVHGGDLWPARYDLTDLHNTLHTLDAVHRNKTGKPLGVSVGWPNSNATKQPKDDHTGTALLTTPGTGWRPKQALVHAADLPAAVAAHVGGLTDVFSPHAAEIATAANVEAPDRATIYGDHRHQPAWQVHRGPGSGPNAPTLGAELEVTTAPQYSPEETRRLEQRGQASARSSELYRLLYGPGNALGWENSGTVADPAERQRLRDEYVRVSQDPILRTPEQARRGERIGDAGKPRHRYREARVVLDRLNMGLPPESFAFVKHDGSIKGNGFEIVTHPATLDVHKARWPKLFDQNGGNPRSPGVVSDSAQFETGLHVHIDRASLGQTDPRRPNLAVGKLVQFVNAAGNREYVESLARRPNSTWASYDPAKTAAVSKLLPGNREARYSAVNLNNQKTVELRIFGGTTRPHEFYQALEFADAIAHFARGTAAGVSETNSPEAFLRFVAANRRRYPHLHAFNADFAARKGLAVGFSDATASPLDGGPPVNLSVALRYGDEDEGADPGADRGQVEARTFADAVPADVRAELRDMVLAFGDALGRGDRGAAAGLLERITAARHDAVAVFCDAPPA